ncbi:MAG: toxin-antitoxin system YwqK family antitoxin, partial [Cetobacterium sp.]
KTGYFKNGLKNGFWKSYDSSRGDLESSFSYVDGELQGPYEIYFSNGTLKENGEYQDGRKVVLWEAGPQYWPSY